MGRLLLRVVWVPLAVLIASAVGLLVGVSIGQERAIQAAGGRSGLVDWVAALLLNPEQLFGALRQIGAFASALTFVPAVLLIVVGEVARIRSALYYVAGSGLAIVAVPLLMRTMQSSGSLGPIAAPVLLVLATAGFAAGFVYWLLAGRSA
jgi:hypothetical protein